MNAQEEIGYLRSAVESEKSNLEDIEDKLRTLSILQASGKKRLQNYEERLFAELLQAGK